MLLHCVCVCWMTFEDQLTIMLTSWFNDHQCICRSRKQSSPKRSPNQKAQAAKRRAAYQEKKVYGPGERVDDIATRLAERVQRSTAACSCVKSVRLLKHLSVSLERFLTAEKSGRCWMDVRSEHAISSGVSQTSWWLLVIAWVVYQISALGLLVSGFYLNYCGICAIQYSVGLCTAL